MTETRPGHVPPGARRRTASSPHPCRTYGVAPPAQRLDSTALSGRSLIRPAWPGPPRGMRIGWPGQARLSLVRQSPLLRGRFSFQDELQGYESRRQTKGPHRRDLRPASATSVSPTLRTQQLQSHSRCGHDLRSLPLLLNLAAIKHGYRSMVCHGRLMWPR
jgi:hypothetical protein